MMAQTENLYEKFVSSHSLPACENRTVSKYEEDRVFCARANDWVNCSCCGKCSPAAREQASQEW